MDAPPAYNDVRGSASLESEGVEGIRKRRNRGNDTMGALAAAMTGSPLGATLAMVLISPSASRKKQLMIMGVILLTVVMGIVIPLYVCTSRICQGIVGGIVGPGGGMLARWVGKEKGMNWVWLMMLWVLPCGLMSYGLEGVVGKSFGCVIWCMPSVSELISEWIIVGR